MQLISDQKKMRQDTCFYEDDGTNTNIRVFISVLKFHEAHGDFLLKNEKNDKYGRFNHGPEIFLVSIEENAERKLFVKIRCTFWKWMKTFVESNYPKQICTVKVAQSINRTQHEVF